MDAYAPAATDFQPFFSGPAGREPGGILYVEDFDPPAEEVADVVQRQDASEPVFSAEELEAARQEGRAEGLQAALADAALVQAELQGAATQALADGLAANRAMLERVAAAQAENAARLVLAVLHAALPSTMARHAGCEAASMVACLLPGLRYEPELRVRTHPDLADLVRALLASLPAGEGGNISVAADAALRPGDVRIAWQHGQAQRNTASIWEAVREALAPLGLPSLKEICVGDRK